MKKRESKSGQINLNLPQILIDTFKKLCIVHKKVMFKFNKKQVI